MTSAAEPSGKNLREIISRVLELQPLWSKDNTPEMQERGVLVRQEAKRAITQILDAISVADSLAIEGSDGAGLKTRVPWVRVFSPVLSPRATEGWYVVCLFARDGRAAYLALGQGATSAKLGFRARPAEYLDERKQRAAAIIGDRIASDERMVGAIDLADTGGLGEAYERATLCAYEYPRDDLPPEGVLSQDLDTLVTLLHMLYESELQENHAVDSPIDHAAAPQDPRAFVEWFRTRFGEKLVESRHASEEAARNLLNEHAGAMTEDQAFELGRLLNTGTWAGVLKHNRFSPAFVGAVMTTLVEPLDQFNQWTRRLWTSSEEEALKAVDEMLAIDTRNALTVSRKLFAAVRRSLIACADATNKR